jgi:Protein of unknown function (DUF4242)
MAMRRGNRNGSPESLPLERSFQQSMRKETRLKLYAIRRRDGWGSSEQLQAAAERSKQVGDMEMSDDIRWIRSYVVHEPDGGLGTVCIYQASSPEKIREHASRADLPATEIFEIGETVLVRPDPADATG